MLHQIWAYRDFIKGSVKREFQSKYRHSLLGAAWTVLNPLAMILVYTLIFSKVMQSKLPGLDGSFAFSIFLCAGLLTWGLFAETVNRLVSVFIDNAHLIKKLNFPRICLPIAVVINACINFAIIFGLFSVFLILSNNFPGWVFFTLFPLLAIQLLFSIGLGICLGVLNVFFRDVGQFFNIFLQFWFWFTPIVYPVSILPDFMRTLLYYNPMTSLITSYQNIFVYQQAPNWSSLLPVLTASFVLCWVGLKLYQNHSSEMVDEL